MNRLIHNAEQLPTTDRAIRSILKDKCNILSYTELMEYSSITDALGPHKALVLLYQFPGEGVGHWVSCWEWRGRLWHYDSYGLQPDEEVHDTHYSDLLVASNLPVVVNPYRHQHFRDQSNTCGRHVALRLLFGAYDHEAYDALVREGLKIRRPDDLVTALTITHTL